MICWDKRNIGYWLKEVSFFSPSEHQDKFLSWSVFTTIYVTFHKKCTPQQMVPPPIQLCKSKPRVSLIFIFLIPIINKSDWLYQQKNFKTWLILISTVTTLVWATSSFPCLCHGTFLGLLVSIPPPRAILHTTAKVIMKTHSSLENPIHIITKMEADSPRSYQAMGGAQLGQPQITFVPVTSEQWVPSYHPQTKYIEWRPSYWKVEVLMLKGGRDAPQQKNNWNGLHTHDEILIGLKWKEKN